MKGKNLVVTGMMLLLSLPIVNCGGGGGGGGNIGNTGITITGGIGNVQGTTDVVANTGTANASSTITFNAGQQNGAVNPFPGTLTACRVTSYTGATNLTPLPAASCQGRLITAGANSCATLLVVEKAAIDAWWADPNNQATVPAGFTANITCDYTSNIGNGGSFTATFPFWLTVDGANMEVTPATATINSSAPGNTKTFQITMGVGPYTIADVADPDILIDQPIVVAPDDSFTVNGNGSGRTGTVTILVKDSLNPAHYFSVAVTVQ